MFIFSSLTVPNRGGIAKAAARHARQPLGNRPGRAPVPEAGRPFIKYFSINDFIFHACSVAYQLQMARFFCIVLCAEYVARSMARPPSCCAPTLSCCAHTLSCCAHTPCHAARSRSIQKITAEGFNPGVAGFRDCARNDKVEGFNPGVAGFRDCARNDKVEGFKHGVAGFRDCARNDKVEGFNPGVAGFRD